VTTDIELILFDLDGVLIELGESPFNRDWIDPQQVLFLDDNHSNILTARKLGMQGLQVKGFDTLLAGLESVEIKF